MCQVKSSDVRPDRYKAGGDAAAIGRYQNGKVYGRGHFLLFILVVLSLLAWLFGAAVGSTGIDSLQAMQKDPLAQHIIWEIRVPRNLGAWLAGGLLGLAGAIAQGIFRNPLADPYLLGSASGASFAVAIFLVFFGFSPHASQWVLRLGLTGAAFVGAALAVLLTLALARGAQHTLRLLLAGVIVGVVLAAFGSLIMLQKPSMWVVMQSFMLGSTAFVGWTSLKLMGAIWFFCILLSMAFSRVLDGLALGEATALSLGVPLTISRFILLLVLALATGTAVAQTGVIAFVGLAAPHLVRSMVHVNARYFVLLTSLMGAVLLLVADLLARGLIAPQELPVGVLTAILGGSYLLWLMYRSKGGLG